MYQLSTLEHYVIRLSDGAQIPFDPKNSDYQVYLEWISKGNSPIPASQST